MFSNSKATYFRIIWWLYTAHKTLTDNTTMSDKNTDYIIKSLQKRMEIRFIKYWGTLWCNNTPKEICCSRTVNIFCRKIGTQDNSIQHKSMAISVWLCKNGRCGVIQYSIKVSVSVSEFFIINHIILKHWSFSVWPSGVCSWEQKKLLLDNPCKSHDHDHQWADLVMAWLP